MLNNRMGRVRDERALKSQRKQRGTLGRISPKAKWNDRTVPSLCLPSAPEPTGEKTRLDASSRCTTVRGLS